MDKHTWKDDAICKDYDFNFFFDKYEEGSLDFRKTIDQFCINCPVVKQCFAVGVSGKEWGVWGGIYLEQGEISREFNNHKTKSMWANIWQTLTMGS